MNYLRQTAAVLKIDGCNRATADRDDAAQAEHDLTQSLLEAKDAGAGVGGVLESLILATRVPIAVAAGGIVAADGFKIVYEQMKITIQ